MAEQRRTVLLGFELEKNAKQNAKQFGTLNERIAKSAEDTARRVAGAGQKMSATWEKSLGQYRATTGQFAGKEIVTEGLYDYMDVLRRQMANIGTQLPTQPIYDWVAATRQAAGQIGASYQTVTTQAGRMVVQVGTGFHQWKMQQQAAAQAAKETAQQTQKGTQMTARSWLGLISRYYLLTRAISTLTRTIIKGFEQLEKSAQLSGMREALLSMGEYFDVQSGHIVASLIRISDQTLSTAQAIQVTNQALIAGARPFAESVPRLFEIARASAVATGKDVMWVFDTLVRGIARAEPRLIDNANIYLSVTEAATEMAEAEGKVYDELDRQEKMVYALNAVLQEGESLINAVSQEALDAQKPFQELRAEFDDLSVVIWESVRSFKSVREGIEKTTKSFRDWQERVKNARLNFELLNDFMKRTSDMKGLEQQMWRAHVAFQMPLGNLDEVVQDLIELREEGGRLSPMADRLIKDLIGAAAASSKLADKLDKTTGKFDEMGRAIPGTIQGINAYYREVGRAIAETRRIEEGEEEEYEPPSEYQRYLEQIYGIEESAYRDRLEAQRDFGEDLLELERDLLEERREIMLDYADEVEDINRQYRDKLADIEDDTNEDLRDAMEDYQDDLEKLQRDHALRLIRIERDYREKILRIEEDYQMAMWDAVGERNATMALKAKRQRALELKRARRDRDRRVLEENENYANRLADLKKRYEDEKRAAEEARRDERAEIEKWRRRQLRDAQTERDRELRDLKASYKKKLDDLLDSYRDRMAEIKAQHAFERRIAQIEYEYRENAYRAHLMRKQAIYQDVMGGGVQATTGPAMGPTGVPGYGPGAGAQPATPMGVPGDLSTFELEWEALEKYNEEILRLEEIIGDVTDTSAENWEEQLDILVQNLESSEDEQFGYFDDVEDGQDSHQRSRLNLQGGYFRADSQAKDRHERNQLNAQVQWQNTALQYDSSHYANSQRYLGTHLVYMERQLYQYWLSRRIEQQLNYFNEVQAAQAHYAQVEADYGAHLQELWLLYNLYGTPPAPTPGVPEVVGKYAAETSAAGRHYRAVENMYEQHLRRLWATYDRVGVPGMEGNEVPLVDGGRRVTQPMGQAGQIDLSNLNLNHAVSVAIRSELAGIDGRIRNEVTRVMGRIFQ